MIPNFSKPFSAFTEGDGNPASFIIGQHYEARDLAIRKLVDLYYDYYDIGDRSLFNSVLARYGLLDDGFNSEEDYIIEQVNKEIKRRGER